MNKFITIITSLLIAFTFTTTVLADGHQVYGPYPITLKSYDGDKTNSVKYTGQMTRHVLHDSLKALVKTGDVEKIKANYTANTMFYDVMNSEIDKFKTLEEEFAQFDQYMETLEIVNIRESGFPDVLDYDGDGAVVISWADFTFKNKKSGNIKTISQHIQHWFNEKGEIVREDYYFNPAQLPQ